MQNLNTHCHSLTQLKALIKWIRINVAQLLTGTGLFLLKIQPKGLWHFSNYFFLTNRKVINFYKIWVTSFGLINNKHILHPTLYNNSELFLYKKVNQFFFFDRMFFFMNTYLHFHRSCGLSCKKKENRKICVYWSV